MSFKLIMIPLAILGCNGPDKDTGSEYLPREENMDTLAVGIPEDTLVPEPSVTGQPVDQVPEKTGAHSEEGAAAAGSTMPAGHYHLVVSFYSPGMGINREAYGKFKEFLGQNAEELVYEETRWGREGEVDFCIMYEGSAAVHTAQMTQKVRRFLSGWDRINISENSACVHKR